jgi:hypothetical protein
MLFYPLFTQFAECTSRDCRKIKGLQGEKIRMERVVCMELYRQECVECIQLGREDKDEDISVKRGD